MLREGPPRPSFLSLSLSRSLSLSLSLSLPLPRSLSLNSVGRSRPAGPRTLSRALPALPAATQCGELARGAREGARGGGEGAGGADAVPGAGRARGAGRVVRAAAGVGGGGGRPDALAPAHGRAPAARPLAAARHRPALPPLPQARTSAPAPRAPGRLSVCVSGCRCLLPSLIPLRRRPHAPPPSLARCLVSLPVYSSTCFPPRCPLGSQPRLVSPPLSDLPSGPPLL